MTTFILDEDVALPKENFSSLEEMYEVIYEEILERKMQHTKKNETFVEL